MSIVSRQQQAVEVRVQVPDVGYAVAAMRAGREQAGRGLALGLKVFDDGRVHARTPQVGRHIPPHLKGRFEADGGSVTLRGVIRESVSDVTYPRVFLILAIFMLLAAILLVVAGNPVPGTIICGIGGVLFGLIGYWLGRLQARVFPIEARNLMAKVLSLLPAAELPRQLP